jgi:ligand-binding SRPBCC domain-containing protein
MPTVVVDTEIEAPVELVFDLARDVEIHCATAAFTRERAVGRITTGLLQLGDEVTFEAVHLGVRQRLTARIVELERPIRFADEMLAGAFSRLRHVHEFAAARRGTRMRDTLTWRSPLGLLGRAADSLFLVSHMRRFLVRRNANLKALAEARAAGAA